MAEKDELDRETPQLFDLMLKCLLKEASPSAVVHFINGLFGKDYPPDSSVTFAATESIAIPQPNKPQKLEKIQSDIILIVAGDDFLVEAQIDDDETIALRVFQYGFAHARRTKTISEDETLIPLLMPEARIIYWETSRKTPDKVTLRFVFPDDSKHDYEIKTFKMLEANLETLEKRKMLLLLPFTLLKFRQEVKNRSTTKEKRRQLANEMKELLVDLENMIERANKEGLLSTGDAGMLFDRIVQMYNELYKPYPEFMEEQMQLEERLKSRSKEMERYWTKYVEERSQEVRLETRLEERRQILDLLTQKHLTKEQLIELLTQEMADTLPQ
ncbi:hypothetical protein FACS1894200_07810 [Spirochaetia bacterium]|nr:hypothetical protein FACS1894200_07810 [Spirochaetia bacterium]